MQVRHKEIAYVCISPDMTASEVVKRLKSTFPKEDIRLLTTLSDGEVVSQKIKILRDDYGYIPFTLNLPDSSVVYKSDKMGVESGDFYKQDRCTGYASHFFEWREHRMCAKTLPAVFTGTSQECLTHITNTTGRCVHKLEGLSGTAGYVMGSIEDIKCQDGMHQDGMQYLKCDSWYVFLESAYRFDCIDIEDFEVIEEEGV